MSDNINQTYLVEINADDVARLYLAVRNLTGSALYAERVQTILSDRYQFHITIEPDSMTYLLLTNDYIKLL